MALAHVVVFTLQVICFVCLLFTFLARYYEAVKIKAHTQPYSQLDQSDKEDVADTKKHLLHDHQHQHNEGHDGPVDGSSSSAVDPASMFCWNRRHLFVISICAPFSICLTYMWYVATKAGGATNFELVQNSRIFFTAVAARMAIGHRYTSHQWLASIFILFASCLIQFSSDGNKEAEIDEGHWRGRSGLWLAFFVQLSYCLLLTVYNTVLESMTKIHCSGSCYLFHMVQQHVLMMFICLFICLAVLGPSGFAENFGLLKGWAWAGLWARGGNNALFYILTDHLDMLTRLLSSIPANVLTAVLAVSLGQIHITEVLLIGSVIIFLSLYGYALDVERAKVINMKLKDEGGTGDDDDVEAHFPKKDRDHMQIADNRDSLFTVNGYGETDIRASGLLNTDSDIGIYAVDQDSYQVFNHLFKQAAQYYHGPTAVSLKPLRPLDFEPPLIPTIHTQISPTFLADLPQMMDPHQSVLSVRYRVGRNIVYSYADADGSTRHNVLPPRMRSGEFDAVETAILGALQAAFPTGAYYRMNHDNNVSTLRRMGALKPNNKDRFAASAGIFRFWPNYRGVYVIPGFHSQQDTCVWINEEDHIRCFSLRTINPHVNPSLSRPTSPIVKGQSMTSGTGIGGVMLTTSPPQTPLPTGPVDITSSIREIVWNVHGTVHAMIDERYSGTSRLSEGYMFDPYLGYITSCPSNLGTTLRFSFLLRLPQLCTAGTLKQHCKRLGLSVRGTNGEHTKVNDHIVDVSNRARMNNSVAEIIQQTMAGVAEILAIEARMAQSDPFANVAIGFSPRNP